MSETAASVLKKEMEYTEEKPVKCGDCKHCEMTDGFLDRSWDFTCRLNPAFPIGVAEFGRCKHFEKKPAKKAA